MRPFPASAFFSHCRCPSSLDVRSRIDSIVFPLVLYGHLVLLPSTLNSSAASLTPPSFPRVTWPCQAGSSPASSHLGLVRLSLFPKKNQPPTTKFLFPSIASFSSSGVMVGALVVPFKLPSIRTSLRSETFYRNNLFNTFSSSHRTTPQPRKLLGPFFLNELRPLV